MEKCAKFLVRDDGAIERIVSEIPCSPVGSPDASYQVSGGMNMWITIGIVAAVLIVLAFSSIVIVKQQTLKIIERLGKYKKIMKPGLNFKIPFFDRLVAVQELRVQQLYVEVETKTKDNVFVTVPVAVQYFILPEKAYEAFYKLENPSRQITSYVFDAVRAQVPKMILDDVFENKEQIAMTIKTDLTKIMDDFGYSIVNALVTDINPDGKVKEAMNEINAQQRFRVAAVEKGEAEKILIVKQAEAESESKRLQGEGIANQRKAIVKGLKESAKDLMDAIGIDPKEVMTTIMLTQYLDTMKELGRDKVLFVNPSPSGMSSLQDAITQAIVSGNESSKDPKFKVSSGRITQ